RVADRPRSQDGRAVHAPTVRAGPPGKLVRADGEHATGTRRVGGKSKPQRPCADDARGWTEPARPAQALAVPIEFVAVLDQRRPEDVPRRPPGWHSDRAPVPGVAVIAGMTVRHPPADVIGQTHVAVVAARRGSHIQRLPPVVVCNGVRPAWV